MFVFNQLPDLQKALKWIHERQGYSRYDGIYLEFNNTIVEVERAVISAKRKAARQRHAVPLLAEFETWLDAQSFIPKGQIGKALSYTRNQCETLNRYVDDGELSLRQRRCRACDASDCDRS